MRRAMPGLWKRNRCACWREAQVTTYPSAPSWKLQVRRNTNPDSCLRERRPPLQGLRPTHLESKVRRVAGPRDFYRYLCTSAMLVEERVDRFEKDALPFRADHLR